MYIDWESKPDWAEVWLETIDQESRDRLGGWYKSLGCEWVSNSGKVWAKSFEGTRYKIHYPSTEQPQDTVSALIEIIRQKDEFIKELITELIKRK